MLSKELRDAIDRGDWKKFRELVTYMDYPEEVTVTRNIVSFKDYSALQYSIYVIHTTKYPHPVGVFKEEVTQEIFPVKVISNEGFKKEEDLTEAIGKAIIETSRRKFRWFGLNQKEMDEVIGYLSRKWEIDVNDVRNCPELMAIVPLWPLEHEREHSKGGMEL